MPFNELHRRDSWPPTVIHLRTSDAAVEAMDQDPFSFFLTSPEEIYDESDVEDLSAGIESDDESKDVIGEISPSSLQHAPLFDLDDGEDNDFFGFAMPISLKDFTTKSRRSGRDSRAAQRAEEGMVLKGLGIKNLHGDYGAIRGRSQVRLMPNRHGRGRGQTRSLSVRKPHSWRAPSPDVYSIREERECDEGGKRVDKSEVMPKQDVTSWTSDTKTKKKVHWAV